MLSLQSAFGNRVWLFGAIISLTSLFLLVLLILSSSSLVASASDEDNQMAPLAFEPAALDLGTRYHHQTVESKVTVRNIGDAPVVILSVHADCGCTVPTIAGTEIEPGGATTMQVVFATHTYVGRVERHVRVTTNKGFAVLTLSADVEPYADWEIGPYFAAMPRSRINDSITTEVSLRYTGEGVARALAVSTGQSWLSAELIEDDGPGTYRVRLNKAVGVPGGHHRVPVTVTTDAPLNRTLAFEAIVPVASDLRISPNPLILPRVPAGELSQTTFRLIGWRQAVIPRIETERGEVVLLESSEDRYMYQLIVRSEEEDRPNFALRVLSEYETEELQIQVVARTL